MFIQCTKKLAIAAKLPIETFHESELADFYDWHANLFTYNRRKGIMLINNATRYSIFLYGLKAAEFKKLDSIILEAIKETFLAEGFSEKQVDLYIEKCDSIKYTKTNSRSLVTQMALIEDYMKCFIEDYLPNETFNIVDLNRLCGRYMLGGSFRCYPIDLLKEKMNS